MKRRSKAESDREAKKSYNARNYASPYKKKKRKQPNYDGPHSNKVEQNSKLLFRGMLSTTVGGIEIPVPKDDINYREERIAKYAHRASLGLPLFDDEE